MSNRDRSWALWGAILVAAKAAALPVVSHGLTSHPSVAAIGGFSHTSLAPAARAALTFANRSDLANDLAALYALITLESTWLAGIHFPAPIVTRYFLVELRGSDSPSSH